MSQFDEMADQRNIEAEALTDKEIHKSMIRKIFALEYFKTLLYYKGRVKIISWGSGVK